MNILQRPQMDLFLSEHPFLLLAILFPVLALTLYAAYKFYKG